ncbi:zf-HC2 domain-containing protein [Butyrivibrio sp. FCS014]|uniref:zf-HC2 domain-containing protein n=1 Tax=Butyrivibrio sp. FCS014 TaxID=1408304 RepID=UPI000466B552|nr:zf-HC2 domain-containing protein [Butyrivibrio sp. FCS014]
MKYQCEMIRDLLPLYKDGVCSDSSRQVVEEHLQECPECAKILDELKDTSYDEIMVLERNNVIESQSRFFKRKSAVVGSVIAAVFAIPILVCLIVNLASGHALSWFFIVLAAMLVPTALIVVPLMATRNRMFLTMTSFTASVILLLGVINIYTGGRWFFIAASATLFGLTVCFAPFIVNADPVKTHLGKQKGLIAMAAITATFFLMMFCIGFGVGPARFFPLAMAISIPVVAFIWIIFAIVRYLPFNGLVKTGIVIAAISLFSYYGNLAVTAIGLAAMGSNGVMMYSEPSISMMFVGIAIGAVFAVIGLLVGKKENNNA